MVLFTQLLIENQNKFKRKEASVVRPCFFIGTSCTVFLEDYRYTSLKLTSTFEQSLSQVIVPAHVA